MAGGDPSCGTGPRELVLVSAGLDLEGGGRAAAGRLLAASAARWAVARGARFGLFHLGSEAPLDPEVSVRHFHGSQSAMAAALWRLQGRHGRGREPGRRRPALLFDLLGPARAQAFLPRRLASPYAVMLLGIEVWRPLSWTRRRALEGARLRLAISRATLDRARPFLPPEARDAAVLHLTLEDRPAAGELDGGLLAEAGEGFLLLVGRMSASERYKGHDELLHAMPRLAAECRSAGLPAPRLLLAGDGDDRLRLEAEARALGVAPAVRFAGFVSEATLAELYRRAAALVMVSRGEGFGLVYLEAMRAGTPCVAARGTAAEEVIANGETGFLVAPGAQEELVAVLLRLLADPGLALQLGEAGRRRLATVFSREGFDRRLAGHLDELTGPAPERPAAVPVATLPGPPGGV